MKSIKFFFNVFTVFILISVLTGCSSSPKPQPVDVAGELAAARAARGDQDAGFGSDAHVPTSSGTSQYDYVKK